MFEVTEPTDAQAGGRWRTVFPGVLATGQVCWELPDGAEAEGNEEQDGHDTHSSLVVRRVAALRRKKQDTVRNRQRFKTLPLGQIYHRTTEDHMSSGLTGSHGTHSGPTCLG